MEIQRQNLIQTVERLQRRHQESLVHGDCKTHGAVMMRKTGEDTAECLKCAEEDGQRQREAEELEARRRHENRVVEQIGIPRRFAVRGLGLTGLHEKQSAALAKISGWCKAMADIESAPNLLLFGPPGTGKTHAACAALWALARRGIDSRYRTAPDLIRYLRASWGAGGGDSSERDAMRQLANFDVLAVDEIGSSFGGDGERVQLSEVICKRYDAMRPTVVVTNLPRPEDLKAAVGDRAYDRLRENSLVVVMAWESLRKPAHHGAAA